jgi:hypothetical protein
MKTETLAYDHAHDILERINLDVEAGTPFGLDEDTNEELTAYDWLGDVLDIEYRVTGDKQYRSAKLCLGWGGPNVWLDTHTGMLSVYWGSDSATVELPLSFIDYLNEALNEMWHS